MQGAGGGGVRIALTALLLAGYSLPALACSPLSDRATRKLSDAIVWGVYTESEQSGFGTLIATRRDKGRYIKKVQVRWNPMFEDDAVNCPEWRPLWKRQKGRFFLIDNGDGTFSVLRQDKLKKA
ncbi:MAG: hypothetical protein SFV20_07810 [Sphingopyxis sp.]|nr:hypothetical protein [Sphingopyxis sp.]